METFLTEERAKLMMEQVMAQRVVLIAMCSRLSESERSELLATIDMLDVVMMADDAPDFPRQNILAQARELVED